jgi:hypothetical protein
MSSRTFLFECNSETYLGCIEHGVFGSNKPWPLEVRVGDLCLLHHYEIGGLLGLWRATTDGKRNLAPRLWGGRFPFQVRVALASPKIAEVPRSLLATHGMNPATGRFDPLIPANFAEAITGAMK